MIMTRIIMSGCNGHMGQVITRIVSERDDCEIVAGIDKFRGVENKYPVYDEIADCKEEADAVIDFSAPSALKGLLEYGKRTKTALILCTTGYNDDEKKAIEEASKDTAILRSANMSLGVNVMAKLVTEAARQLDAAGFDIEIVEKHHRLKKDAPSGTALYLAEAANAGAGGKHTFVYDRSDRFEKRPDNEIGISAVRGGTIPGDHDVIFAGEDEVITFSHRAYSKAVFGKGAVMAALKMNGMQPGLYDMSAVLD